jgi:N-acetylglucosaminyldiphosphoundecaprenol N-acetyl-beta-D-mannosaminyltransferase
MSISPADRDTGYATVPLMGLDVAAISERETIDHVLDRVADRQGGWLCTANLDILRQYHDSIAVRDLIAEADLVVADGMPLIWAGGLQGSPLPERVAGSTLVVSLTAAAAEAGASVFLLGGNPGTAEATAARLTELNPEVRFVGTLCPPFGFEKDPEYMADLAAEVQKADPDIVYVGLGFPKQEHLIAALREYLPHTWFISCGVSFSFVAGEFRRAPVLVQKLGLEWLHRLVQEPRRLFRRYLVDGLPFLVELMWSAVTFRMRTGRATS